MFLFWLIIDWGSTFILCRMADKNKKECIKKLEESMSNGVVFPNDSYEFVSIGVNNE